MSALTNVFENKLIDWLFRGQAIGINGASAAAGTGPTTIYVALFTTVAPTDAGGGTEVSGGGYARASIASSLTNWSGTQGVGTTAVSSGTSGTISNNIAITFPAPTANWGSVTYMALFDAATSGNMLAYAQLGASISILSGTSAPSFAAGSVNFQIDN